jgi:hypothetical protein
LQFPYRKHGHAPLKILHRSLYQGRISGALHRSTDPTLLLLLANCGGEKIQRAEKELAISDGIHKVQRGTYAQRSSEKD